MAVRGVVAQQLYVVRPRAVDGPLHMTRRLHMTGRLFVAQWLCTTRRSVVHGRLYVVGWLFVAQRLHMARWHAVVGRHGDGQGGATTAGVAARAGNS